MTILVAISPGYVWASLVQEHKNQFYFILGVISPVLSAKKAWEVTAENEIKKKMEHVTLNMHTSSDSESPTEPVSQQLIEQLRNRVINCKNN